MIVDTTEWFFMRAEDVFGFLATEYGLSIVERHRHHEGNYIVFADSTRKFAIECAPDWNSIVADVVVRVDGEPQVKSMEEVGRSVKTMEPMTYPSTSGSPDLVAMETQMERWARTLRSFLAGPPSE